MKKLTKKERAKKVNHAIREVWSSLDSHLDSTHAKGLKAPDDNDFHKKCVHEYAKLIVTLSELY